MKLVQGDWHYQSVLKTKQQAILEAVNLVKVLEMYFANIKGSIDESIYDSAMTAIENFKVGIRAANRPGNGYVYLKDKSDAFFKSVENESISSFLSSDVSKHSSQYRSYLKQQDSAETLSARRSDFFTRVFVDLLTVSVISLYAAAWIFTPYLAFVSTLTMLPPLAVIAMIGLSAKVHEQSDYEVKRDILSEGIAVTNLEDKFKLDFPSASTFFGTAQTGTGDNIDKFDISRSDQQVAIPTAQVVTTGVP